MNNRQRRSRKTEHHDREEAGHEHPRRFIAGKEAVQVSVDDFTRSICKIADLEPYDRIDNVVQT
ncbi:hypothetical protein D3C76_1868480 [compost metagenome]